MASPTRLNAEFFGEALEVVFRLRPWPVLSLHAGGLRRGIPNPAECGLLEGALEVFFLLRPWSVLSLHVGRLRRGIPNPTECELLPLSILVVAPVFVPSSSPSRVKILPWHYPLAKPPSPLT